MKGHTSAAESARPIDVLALDSADATTVLKVPEAGVSLEAVERALIAFALTRTAGNRTHAARLLGLTRSALLYRLHKHGLDTLADAPSAQRTSTVHEPIQGGLT